MQPASLWKLFEKTGNIGVYILYKKMLEQDGMFVAKEGHSADANSAVGNSDKGN